MPTEGGRRQPTVHVVDDDQAVRRAIAMLLRSARLSTETYPSGMALLDAMPTALETRADCVLTDMRMLGLDGLELLLCLRAGGFHGPVVVMTAHGDVPTAVRAMKAGAMDFIEKPFEDTVLLAVISAALDNAQALNPQALGGSADAAAQIAALSPREREVLNLLMAGKPNKMIARDLGLSPRTVEIHRARLMTRLGVGSLAEAVRIAVRAERSARVDESSLPS